MMPRKPPILAIWLLNNFGPARHSSPLAGDLCEEFRDGRSRSWFWRQTALIVLRRLGRRALSPENLVLGPFLFLCLALPDYAFWLLNRPPHLGGWILTIVPLAPVVLMWTPVWNRRWSDRDWFSTRKAVLWVACLCLHAWSKTDPLGARLWTDATVTGIGWACLKVYFCKARPRVRKLI
jgi:hypothetical protein